MTWLYRALADTAKETASTLDQLLADTDVPERRLWQAMRYSSLEGGKRLRPFLVLAGAEIFSIARPAALRVAAAVEMVHCYSLVHDDLPAMDDDDLRRGQLTTHRQFDEATAILAGDALLTMAFEVLAAEETHGDATVRCALIRDLAAAAGPRGMVGGQMLDLLAPELELDVSGITRLQQMKTGRLFTFSAMAGATMAKASANLRHALRAYAHDLGLAFQIVDDLLDAEGDAEDVGKATGKDADRGKATFVSLLGNERAREQAEMLIEQAIQHLEPFQQSADPLRNVARFVLERRH